MGMITLLTGQADPDPARFAKSPDGDEVYIESFEYWDEHKDKTDYYKSMEFNNGDVVINGGAAFGNDTQYFDDQVGDNGIVYAFDPNMSENNNVKSQSIKIIPKVLWNKTTTSIIYYGWY